MALCRSGPASHRGGGAKVESLFDPDTDIPIDTDIYDRYSYMIHILILPTTNKDKRYKPLDK